jgi:hypothetical protein
VKIEFSDDQVLKMASAIKALRELDNVECSVPLRVLGVTKNGCGYAIPAQTGAILVEYQETIRNAFNKVLEARRAALRAIANGNEVTQ